MSSSVKPMPFSIARAPARSRPSVIMRLRCLGSNVIVASIIICPDIKFGMSHARMSICWIVRHTKLTGVKYISILYTRTRILSYVYARMGTFHNFATWERWLRGGQRCAWLDAQKPERHPVFMCNLIYFCGV